MNSNDKKEWMEHHGTTVECWFDEPTYQNFTRWYTNNGMRFIGSGDSDSEAIDSIFFDVTETLYHNCK